LDESVPIGESHVSGSRESGILLSENLANESSWSGNFSSESCGY